MDPFAVLGVPATASLDEVRAARRRLAKQLHPDAGGDHASMGEVNRAFDLAVKAILRPDVVPTPTPPETARPNPRRMRRVGGRLQYDSPSFSVDVLPVEAFEALLVVATWAGEVLVDDPPYLLDAHLVDPFDCWCRLELVPEAGGTMVSVTVAGLEGARPPHVDSVRDLWVAMLNDLGAPEP